MRKFSVFSTVLLCVLVQGASAEEIRYVYSLSSIAPVKGETDVTYQVNLARRRCDTCPGKEKLPGRPFGPDAAEHWAGVQMAFTDRWALALNTIFTLQPGQSLDYGSYQVEARYRVSHPQGLPFDLAGAGGYLREIDGTSVVQGKGAVSKEWGPANLTGNLHIEKAFAPDRDAVDVFLTAGNSYRITDWFRAGLEYVGQDLEEAWEEEEAEGGARHLLGPTLTVQAIRGSLQLAASPSLAVTPAGTGFLMRGMFSYSF